MRYATFNVLADAYTGYGDYSHVGSELMQPGGRLKYLQQQINDLQADVVGLQEAEINLVEAYENDKNWQSFWTPKGNNKPDGCLTLVRSGIEVAKHESFSYNDDSGHVFQLTNIGKLAVINTHIKWAPADEPQHIGASQTQELLDTLGSERPAVILADCNDRPGGPIRTIVENAGFIDLSGDRPTAIVNGELVGLDMLAIRGIKGYLVQTDYNIASIPNKQCASDHVPLIAELRD